MSSRTAPSTRAGSDPSCPPVPSSEYVFARNPVMSPRHEACEGLLDRGERAASLAAPGRPSHPPFEENVSSSKTCRRHAVGFGPRRRRCVGRVPNPLAAWLAASMASRLAEAQRALARSLSLGARERTLELLRTLAGRWGRPSPDGLVVDVPLTQDDMAAMLGLARESVNRALRALHRTGAVRRSGRSYVLASGSSSEV